MSDQDRIGQVIHEYAQEYEMRDPDYTPNAVDRVMLEDFGNGLVDELSARLGQREPLAEGRHHLTVSGTFQSDKYPASLPARSR